VTCSWEYLYRGRCGPRSQGPAGRARPCIAAAVRDRARRIRARSRESPRAAREAQFLDPADPIRGNVGLAWYRDSDRWLGRRQLCQLRSGIDRNSRVAHPESKPRIGNRQPGLSSGVFNLMEHLAHSPESACDRSGRDRNRPAPPRIVSDEELLGQLKEHLALRLRKKNPPPPLAEAWDQFYATKTPWI
jgi:hypothetical protein